jgi:hypothetical protein
LTDDKPIWTNPDLSEVMQWTSFMSDIRNRGSIWPHIELAQRHLPEWQKVKPVKGLTQARQRVKEADRKREETKRIKAEKIRAARKAKELAGVRLESMAFIGPVAEAAGPAMVIPRKASPVLRIINADHPPASPSPKKHSHRTSHRSSSGSSSSHSDHLLTPTSSNTANSPKATVFNDKITPGGLRSMGLNAEIPNEIAHHLADMLTRFQAIGFEKAAKGRHSDEISSIHQPVFREQGRRRRKERKAHADLEVSVDSESFSSDVSDGLTIGTGSEKGSEQSWMTGDLNMDEDTKAVPSGAGTDVGSAP